MVAKAENVFGVGLIKVATQEQVPQKLHAKIGQTDDGEGFFRQRARAQPMSERQTIIKARADISITRQGQLRAVPRSSAYTRPQRVAEGDLELMRQIDKLYLKWPFYGSRRLRVELQC